MLATLSHFSIIFQHANPHGVLAAVSLPSQPEPIPREVQLALFSEEWEFAASLKGYRQMQFVGGRLALHGAAQSLGVSPWPSLPDRWGAPILPAKTVGSISHKRTLAVGMVARHDGSTLGVDLETYGPPRPRVAAKVLTPQEQRAIRDLPDDRRWFAILLRFSLKEALYKALHPHLRRYVDFQEVSIFPDLQGSGEVILHFPEADPDWHVSLHYDWWQGYLLSSARVSRQEVRVRGGTFR